MNAETLTLDLETSLGRFEARLRELVDSDVEFIRLIQDDLVTAGGKRIRPRLVLLASRALGGVPREMELALAVELLHSATLLHDDLVDDAETRRGREAAFRKYGNAVSVLSGDYLLSRVLYLLAETGRLELVRLFADVARQLAEGEVFQFQVAALGEYSKANYERIIAGKTAALMRACTEGVALLADAAPMVREALRRFGYEYGMVFQMRDDYLDLMGDGQVLGKPVGGDVREGKVTLITLHLLERAAEEVGPILARRAAKPGDIARLRELAIATGAAEAVVEAITARAEQAVAALDPLPDSPAKAQLIELARSEVRRVR
ncbi:polyprenyl synthetase family protein [Marinithermus hydrothermalis]|uniref:Geranyltranstransferase n=1 Tax=Marinithermus hydrothermalis (strain DSM 14884 / JCM 11576 / T1) TaxID=869210 RepID=F2NM86_MARHT|nr:polyprenyl synthetase family protein [Marinithermus hydrothermalis]AEB11556.1 Geranyltranstransferase [Marinithermus hydrothermalis DSM 14884]